MTDHAELIERLLAHVKACDLTGNGGSNFRSMCALAADALAALVAERHALREECEQRGIAAIRGVDLANEATAEAAALRAMLDEAREVLTPFVRWIYDKERFTSELRKSKDYAGLLESFRSARALFAKLERKGGGNG